jgi:AcrR family transcriptional regulator
MNRRLTPRGVDRRRQLMDFAARRFAENGYHPTSVAEIVSGMGVGKGVFYWYFSSKEELLVEILREAQYDLRRYQELAIADEADPLMRIELGIRASLRWFSEQRHLSTLFQFAATEERFAPTMRRGQEVAVADAARHVEEAISRGRIVDNDGTDTLKLTHAIIGVTNHLARVYILEQNEPPEVVGDAAVSFCLFGLLGVSNATPTARRPTPSATGVAP